jgi:hypothetical protein
MNEKNRKGKKLVYRGGHIWLGRMVSGNIRNIIDAKKLENGFLLSYDS